MADVEMKDDKAGAGADEDQKKQEEETKIEEPTDHYYGKNQSFINSVNKSNCFYSPCLFSVC